MTESGYDGSQG